jgi:hypothetical protein
MKDEITDTWKPLATRSRCSRARCVHWAEFIRLRVVRAGDGESRGAEYFCAECARREGCPL